jgi:hypothetical protein
VSGFESDSALLVFSVMSCLSLALSLFLHLKNRALARLPKNLHASVSDRTFSVFNPYPEHRRTLHSYLTLLPFVTWIGALAVAYLTLTIFAMGLALGFAAFIFCLALMMVDEAFEIYKNASMLVNAVESRVGFGLGDLAVLSVLKKILPKLRAYYLLLSVAFLASLIALPYVVPAAVMAFAQAVGAVFEFSASAGVLAAFIIVLVFGAAEMMVYVAVRKVKSRILGFPSTQSLISAASANARSRITSETLQHVFDENPEELTY